MMIPRQKPLSRRTVLQFFNYFRGRDVGHAIAIGSVRKYAAPLELAAAFGIRAPQSFVYV